MQSPSPRITVLFPFRDAASYVGAALKSVLDQSFPDFEVLAIDDGSVDDGAAIVERLADNRVRIIHLSGVGVPRALNAALDEARGEFVARMDADDIALPHRFERQLSYLRRHRDVQLVGCQARIMDLDGNVTAARIRKPVGAEWVSRYSKFASPVVGPTFFGTRTLFQRLGGYADLPVAEDYDFLVRALAHGYKLDNLDEELLLYRCHGNGVSRRNIKRTLVAANWVRACAARKARAVETSIAAQQLRRVRTTALFAVLYDARNRFVIGLADRRFAKKLFCGLGLISIALLSKVLRRDGIAGLRARKILAGQRNRVPTNLDRSVSTR